MSEIIINDAIDSEKKLEQAILDGERSKEKMLEFVERYINEEVPNEERSNTSDAVRFFISYDKRLASKSFVLGQTGTDIKPSIYNNMYYFDSNYNVVLTDDGKKCLLAMQTIAKAFDGEVKHFKSEAKMKSWINNVIKSDELIKGNSFIYKKKRGNKSNNTCFTIGLIKVEVLDFLHEFAHVFYQFSELNKGQFVWAHSSQDIMELRADAFSRGFWMSRESFLKVVVLHSYQGKCNIDEVAKEYCVTPQAVYIRGKELFLWN